MQNNIFKSILIYGPPGSGKGTVSKFLNLSESVYHVSSGDMFRGLDKNSKLGKHVNEFLIKGNLIPDELTIEIWHEYVLAKINAKEFLPDKQFLLLDGIPRTLKQATLLEKFIKVNYIIVLDVEDINILIKRMKNRALLENRTDDADEKILNNRLDIYLNDTTKLLKHYPKDIIFHFNANQKRLEVIRDVLIKCANLIE